MPPNTGVFGMLSGALMTSVAVLMAVALVAAAAGTVIVWRSRREATASAAVTSAKQRMASAEAAREQSVARVAHASVRAAEARAAGAPAIAHAESLRTEVRIIGPGQLRVRLTPNTVATVVQVPEVVTERMRADSAAIGALSLALAWDDSVASAQAARLAAEASVRDAARQAIAALERERRPRCGRKCGIAIGVVGVVALGVAAEQARRLVRD